jgi:hypothetical protein
MIEDRNIRRITKRFKKLFKGADDIKRLRELEEVIKHIEKIETKNSRLVGMKEISFLD